MKDNREYDQLVVTNTTHTHTNTPDDTCAWPMIEVTEKDYKCKKHAVDASVTHMSSR